MASPRETNLAAYNDSQATNKSGRSTNVYSDLDLFFGTKAASKDINKVDDVQAVKRAVRNLVLLDHYEKVIQKSRFILDEYPDISFRNDALLLIIKSHYYRK